MLGLHDYLKDEVTDFGLNYFLSASPVGTGLLNSCNI